jgi:hypothetical protein
MIKPVARYRMVYDPWVQLDNGDWVRANLPMVGQAERYGTPVRWHETPPVRGRWMARQVTL